MPTSVQQLLSKTKLLNATSIASAKTLNKIEGFIPTGALPLDIIMGGGVPIGRMIEIYGDNSTGKTLVGLHILANTQHMGGIGVLLDTEVAASDEIMDMVGIDRNELIYRTPETVEEVWSIITDLIESKQQTVPDVPMTIVWDSVAGTSSEEELESVKKKGLSSHTMAVHARLLSQMGRLIPQMVSKNHTAAVLINQTRENINVLFGEQKSTFGGRSIGYYASVRLELTTIGKIKLSTGVFTGINVKAYIAKNKVAPPFGRCELPIIFGIGVDEPGAIFEWLCNSTALVSKGGWWSLTIPNVEVRFQKPDWPRILQEHDADIRAYVYNNAGFAFEVEE